MASAKPVFQKHGLKPAHRAAKLYVPTDAAKSLGPVPAEYKLGSALSGQFDFILSFYEARKAFETELPKLKAALKKSGMAWVCWRKGNVTDLNRDSIAVLVESSGLETVSSCAIDDNWSALKLMYPKDQRRP